MDDAIIAALRASQRDQMQHKPMAPFSGPAKATLDYLSDEVLTGNKALEAFEKFGAAFPQLANPEEVLAGERPMSTGDPEGLLDYFGPGILGRVGKVVGGPEFNRLMAQTELGAEVGDRSVAMAKLKSGEPLTEPEFLALSPAMRKKYQAARVEQLRMAPMEFGPVKPGAAVGLDHTRLREVPDVPQRDLERFVPTRGVPAELQRLAENEDAYKQIMEWTKRGMTDEGIGWYNTDGIRQAFLDELGPELGQKRFDRFMDLVSVTSAGSNVQKNIHTASFYDLLAEAMEKPAIPLKGSGYGHKAQHLHNAGARNLFEGGDALDVIKNPKRVSFAENLKGNQAPVTVDKHNVRAWGIASRDPAWLATKLEDEVKTAPKWWNERKFGKWNKGAGFNPREFFSEGGPGAKAGIAWDDIPATFFMGAPKGTAYKALEDLNKRLAKDLGLTPAQAQAALWLGAGERTGLASHPLAFAKVFEENLLERAAQRGQAPREVLIDFLRGKRPLQVGGTAIGAGALMSAQDDPYGS